MGVRRWSYVIGLVDESGSMSSVENETITNYDLFLGRLHEIPRDIRVSLSTFNNARKVHYSGAYLGNAHGLAEHYDPNGDTALRDSILAEIATHEQLVENTEREKVVMAILTDGQDTCSKSTLAQVKVVIDRKTKQGWEFFYFGPDTRGGRDMGIKPHQVFHLEQGGEGIARAFEQLAERTEQLLLTSGS